MRQKFLLRPLSVSADPSRAFPRPLQPAKTVAFSGSGWLLPFHIGVAHVLYNSGVVGPQTTLAGLSGGALAATFMLMDMSRDEAMEEICAFARSGLSFGNYGAPLRALLRRKLPEDIVEKANARLRVSVVKVDMYGFHDVLIDKYTSKDDIVDSLLASSHIPYYLSKQFSATFRGASYLDGGKHKLASMSRLLANWRDVRICVVCDCIAVIWRTRRCPRAAAASSRPFCDTVPREAGRPVPQRRHLGGSGA